MKILNLTHNDVWWPYHFNVLCNALGHIGATLVLPKYDLTEAEANASWVEHKARFDSVDAVFVSHVAHAARMVLQSDWKKPLYIWFYFRFDHCIEDPAIYYQLLRDAVKRPNVKFLAATEQDRRYVRIRLGNVPIDVVPPLHCVDLSQKVNIGCTPDYFFIGSKPNDVLLKPRLSSFGIPFQFHPWEAGQPDLRDTRGIVHFPYVNSTKTLQENMALENIYFLPDIALFDRLLREPGYWWDSHGEVDLTVTPWYNDLSNEIFVHYASFDELKRITNSPDFPALLAEKKCNLRNHNRQYASETLEKWKRVFGS